MSTLEEIIPFEAAMKPKAAPEAILGDPPPSGVEGRVELPRVPISESQGVEVIPFESAIKPDPTVISFEEAIRPEPAVIPFEEAMKPVASTAGDYAPSPGFAGAGPVGTGMARPSGTPSRYDETSPYRTAGPEVFEAPPQAPAPANPNAPAAVEPIDPLEGKRNWAKEQAENIVKYRLSQGKTRVPEAYDLSKETKPRIPALQGEPVEQSVKARRRNMFGAMLTPGGLGYSRALDPEKWAKTGPVTPGEVGETTHAPLPFTSESLGDKVDFKQAIEDLQTSYLMKQMGYPKSVWDYPERGEDEDLVHAVLLSHYSEAARGRTFLADYYQMVRQTAPWMAEIYATGGAGLTRMGVTGSALRKLIGTVGRETLRTAMMSHRVAETAVDFMTPQGLQVTPKGELVFAAAGKSPAKAFMLGFENVLFENLSEQSGEMLTARLGALVRMNPGMDRIVNVLDQTFGRRTWTKQIASQAGFSNMIGESLEERLASAMHAAFGTDPNLQGMNAYQQWAQVIPSWRQLGLEAALFGPMQAVSMLGGGQGQGVAAGTRAFEPTRQTDFAPGGFAGEVQAGGWSPATADFTPQPAPEPIPTEKVVPGPAQTPPAATEKEKPDAETVRGSQEKVRAREGRKDIRRKGQEQVGPEPKGAQPEAQVAQPEAAPAEEAKQAWEMTKAEYLDHAIESDVRLQAAELEGDEIDVTAEHSKLVAEAVRRGENVPDRVLDEYPGLKKGSAGPESQHWRMTRDEFIGAATTDEARRTKGIIHETNVAQSVAEGKPVPRAVLEDYKGEKWADEALAKMEQPAQPTEVEPSGKAGELPAWEMSGQEHNEKFPLYHGSQTKVTGTPKIARGDLTIGKGMMALPGKDVFEGFYSTPDVSYAKMYARGDESKISRVWLSPGARVVDLSDDIVSQEVLGATSLARSPLSSLKKPTKPFPFQADFDAWAKARLQEQRRSNNHEPLSDSEYARRVGGEFDPSSDDYNINGLAAPYLEAYLREKGYDAIRFGRETIILNPEKAYVGDESPYTKQTEPLPRNMPKLRRIAKQRGVDISDIKGKGAMDRIIARLEGEKRASITESSAGAVADTGSVSGGVPVAQVVPGGRGMADRRQGAVADAEEAWREAVQEQSRASAAHNEAAKRWVKSREPGYEGSRKSANALKRKTRQRLDKAEAAADKALNNLIAAKKQAVQPEGGEQAGGQDYGSMTEYELRTEAEKRGIKVKDRWGKAKLMSVLQVNDDAISKKAMPTQNLRDRLSDDKGGFEAAKLTRALGKLVQAVVNFIEPSKKVEIVQGEDVYATVIRGIHKPEGAVLSWNQQKLAELGEETLEAFGERLAKLPQATLDNMMLARGEPSTAEGLAIKRDALAALNEDEKALIPAIQAIADFTYKYARTVDPELRYVEDYFYGQYKNPSQVTKFLDHWKSTTRWQKEKTFPTYADARAWGLELKHKNPVDNLRSELRAVAYWGSMVWLRESLFKMGKGEYIVEPKDAMTWQKQQWDRVEDPVFRDVLVAPELADMLNKLISTNRVSQSRGLSLLRTVNSVLRTLKFMGAAFHHLVVAKQGIVESIRTAYRSPSLFLKSLKPVVSRGFKKGDPMFGTPEFLEFTELGGGQRYSIESAAADAFEKFMTSPEASDLWKVLRIPARYTTAIPRQYINWLFNGYIPRLNYVKYLIEVQIAEKKLGRPLTDNEKINIIKEGQNFYGEMNERLFGRSGTATSIMRFVWMAPGFREGNYRTMAKAAVHWNKGGPTGGAWRSRANIPLSLLFTGIAATVGSLIMTGEPPDWPENLGEVRDLFKVKTPWKDNRDRTIYVDLLTYDKDYWDQLAVPLWKLATGHPLKAGSEAGSVFLKTIGGMEAPSVSIFEDMFRLMTGEVLVDWKGERIYYITDTPLQKLNKLLSKWENDIAPIPFGVWQRMVQKRIHPVTALVLAMAGVRPSSSEHDKQVDDLARNSWSLRYEKEKLYYYLASMNHPREAVEDYNAKVDALLNHPAISRKVIEDLRLGNLKIDVEHSLLPSKVYRLVGQKSLDEEDRAKLQSYLTNFGVTKEQARKLLQRHYRNTKGAESIETMERHLGNLNRRWK